MTSILSVKLDKLFSRKQLAAMRQLFFIMASLSITLALWEMSSRWVFGEFLLPPPSATLQALGPMSASGDLFRDISISLSRVAVGYSAGVIFALILGVLMGRIRLINDLVDPSLQFIRFLSPTAMIPIVIIWFGIGELAKYALVFWGCTFIVLLNTIAGVVRTPIVRQQAAQCLGANEAQIFRYVVLPSAVPYIVVGMRLALGSAFISIIPAELLAADSGLGYLLQQSSLLLQTDRIFVALLTICTIGFLADRLFQLMIHLFLKRYMATV